MATEVPSSCESIRLPEILSSRFQQVSLGAESDSVQQNPVGGHTEGNSKLSRAAVGPQRPV